METKRTRLQQHRRPAKAARRVAGGTPESVAGIARGMLGELGIGALPRVALRFWDGSELAAEGPAAATVVVRDPEAIAHLVHAPRQLGLARAWVQGLLDVDGDLEAVVRARAAFQEVHLSAASRARLAFTALRVAGAGVLKRPPVPAIEARVSGRRTSLARDRGAVRHHYDFSNRFYELVLGPTMVYSCAYFAAPDDTLETAQERKLDVICRKLRLAEGDRLLDIGCGWGALVLHAAKRYGVDAVGVTLSEPQAELARSRAEQLGVQDRVEIRVQDYREIADGPFDKIASVGMYEHVGRAQLDVYAGAVMALLPPGGLFLNHGITRLLPHAPEPDDFITRYVFPDSALHPVSDVVTAMQSAGLEVRDVESLREHYALTLRRWVANLAQHRDETVAEVGVERERVWRLYMLGSALGFEAGEISVHQVLAARPGGPHGLPLDRARLLEVR